MTMGYDVQVVKVSEFLRSHVSGVVDLDASRELLRKLVAAAARHRVHRVLLDGRDSRSNASTADIWSLANDLSSLGVSREHRVALLLQPPQADFDRGAFLELCATNRGFQLRAFHDFEQAFDWLTEGEDPGDRGQEAGETS
jgi:hypothetical protein